MFIIDSGAIANGIMLVVLVGIPLAVVLIIFAVLSLRWWTNRRFRMKLSTLFVLQFVLAITIFANIAIQGQGRAGFPIPFYSLRSGLNILFFMADLMVAFCLVTWFAVLLESPVPTPAGANLPFEHQSEADSRPGKRDILGDEAELEARYETSKPLDEAEAEARYGRPRTLDE